MKKLFVIGGVLVAVFVLIFVLTNKSNETKLKDNPYGTDKLQTSTINLLGNENYNNIILPKDLEKKIESGEEVTAYFFSPECSYCLAMTPVLMPVAKEMDIEVFQFNLLEFGKNAAPYGIEGTPTLIHYKDGVEIDRLYGGAPEDMDPEVYIRNFFDNYELD